MAQCFKTEQEYVNHVTEFLKTFLGDTREDMPIFGLQYLRAKVEFNSPQLVESFDKAVEGLGLSDKLQDSYREVEFDITKTDDAVKGYELKPLTSATYDFEGAENSQESDETGGSLNDFMDKGATARVITTDGGIDRYAVIFFHQLGIKLDKTQLKRPYEAIRVSKTFDEFYEWMQNTYGDVVNPSDRVQTRNFRRFYITNRPVNKLSVTQRLELVYVNAQVLTDGALGKVSPDQQPQKFHKKSSQIFRNSDGRVINLENGRIDPDYINTNFIDTLKTKIRGSSVMLSTYYLSIKNILRLKVGKDGGWYSVNNAGEIGVAKLNKWQAQLLRQGLSIVGLSGGDKGNIIMAKVDPSMIEEVADKETMVGVLRDEGYDAKIIAQLEAADTFSDWYQQYWTWYNQGKLNESQVANFRKITGLFDAVIIGNFSQYLEADSAHLIKDDIDSLIRSAKDIPTQLVGDQSVRAVPMHLHVAGMIARHEWLKSVRGLYYPRFTSLHTFNRMRIPVTKGIVLEGWDGFEGREQTNHVIFDHTKVDMYINGKKIEHYTQLEGLINVKNIIDGLTMTSTAHLDKTAKFAGNEAILDGEANMREAKTVIMHLSEDMENYVEMKHSEQQAPGGLLIVAKDANPDDRANHIIKTVKNSAGEVAIYDGNGNSVDMVSDLDVVKTSTGEYDLTGDYGGESRTHYGFKLNERSRRVVILPHTRSNDSVYGPGQAMNMLNPQNLSPESLAELEPFIEQMLDLMKEQSGAFTDVLLDAVENPGTLRRLVGHMYSEQADEKDNVRNKTFETDGIGVHHPDMFSRFRGMLLNSFLVRGAMQARSSNDQLTKLDSDRAGSDYVLKPDMEDRIKVDENGVPTGVILSSANHAIFNKIVKIIDEKVGAESILFDMQGAMEISPEEYNRILNLPKGKRIRKIRRMLRKDPSIVNAWLAKNPQYVMTYRSPIGQLSSIAAREIQEFVPDEGNAIYHHPVDVFKRLVGDFDIDESGVVMLSEAHVKAFKDFQNSVLYREDAAHNADLDIFSTGTKASLMQVTGSLQEMAHLLKGSGIQGQAAVYRNLMNTLSQHVIGFEFSDGTKARPKNPNDRVVMDYAPLEKHLTTKHLNEMGWTGAKVVVINGVKYLETNAAHEAVLIINAATDNVKNNLFTKVWGFNDNNWLMSRLFVTEDGIPLSKEHIQLLRGRRDLSSGDFYNGILSQFNYSKLKKGRDGVGRKMNLHSFFFKLKGLHEFLNLDIAEQADILQNRGRTKFSSGELRITRLGMRGNITAEEQLLIDPWSKVIEKYGEDLLNSPFEYNEDRFALAHYKALEQAVAWGEKNINISMSGMRAADNFAIEFLHAFHKIFRENDRYTSESISYDDELLFLTKEYEKKLNKLKQTYGEDAATVASLRYLLGYYNAEEQQFKNMLQVLPPLEVWDSKVYTGFMGAWEKAFFSKQEISKKELNQHKSSSNGKGAQLLAKCRG